VPAWHIVLGEAEEMSDQPKPAGDYSDRPPHEWGTNQKPKPATSEEPSCAGQFSRFTPERKPATSLRQEATAQQSGEWTEEILSRVAHCELTPLVASFIIDEHNAALAAERRERDCANDDYHALQEEHDKLEQQLAAGREVISTIILKDSQRDLMSKMTIADVEKLREQLAAANKRIDELSNKS
jgi:hypothetical protein